MKKNGGYYMYVITLAVSKPILINSTLKKSRRVNINFFSDSKIKGCAILHLKIKLMCFLAALLISSE
jgi:hypothetical protein